ncbi:Putative cytosolic protein [Staphylococcus aureus]|nr:Putative cytosolic protein [Staphylococcus aureus]
MKDKYKIDPGIIKNNTEETTAISKISYEVENANLYGADSEDITRQIEDLKAKKNSLLILNMLIVTLILLME